jgi:diguanylate cyclase (GGDEF)-like protein
VATLSFVEGPLAGTLVGITRGSSLLLGRGRDAHIRIPDENVSRRHARLSWVDDTCCIEPLGRATTWVEGTPVLSPRVLTSGARIQLGPRVRLRFDLHDAVERRSLSDLYDAAVRDPLTGAHNRRYLEDRLRTELAYSNRHGVPVSLLLIDLDHFKQVNDRHGHEAGDRVLRFVVAALRKTLRPEDVLARYGGEELCVLLRGLDVEQAARLAERIRSSLAALRVPVASGAKLAITASIGVACVPAEPNPTRAESSRPYDGPRGSSPYDGAALIERADRALYAAKHAGRNRCAIAGRLPPRGGAE